MRIGVVGSPRAVLSLAQGAVSANLQAYIVAQHVGEKPGSFSVEQAMEAAEALRTAVTGLADAGAEDDARTRGGETLPAQHGQVVPHARHEVGFLARLGPEQRHHHDKSPVGPARAPPRCPLGARATWRRC